MEIKKLICPITPSIRYHVSPEYHEATLSRARKRYKENRVKILQYLRDWRKKNPTKARDATRRWIDKNRERFNKMQRDGAARRKSLVLNAYGSKCTCCGEHRFEFLTIEHLFKNGARHRKKVKDFYRWLIANNFPKEGFTILCYNCNMAEGLDRVCPHKKERGVTELEVLELHRTIDL